MKTDTEILQRLIGEIRLDPQIKMKVEDGWVYFEGDVDFEYERKAAEQAVEKIEGIKGVVNHVKIKPRKVDWRGHLIN
jgi:osmotically-inducible protein OsmY